MTTSPPDERRGLPSASEYPRIHHCPGYLNLKATLTAFPDAESWTLSGKRIAQALEGILRPDALTDEEQVTFRALIAGRRDILNVTLGEGTILETRSEERLWLKSSAPMTTDDPTERLIFSGRFDFMANVTAGEDFVIIDDKSGRIEVQKATGNLQLRALAVLVVKNFGFKTGFVAVNQPWFRPPFSICYYSEDDLTRARADLFADLTAAKNPDALRHAGEWCRYCPCRTSCLEARAAALTLGELNPAGMPDNRQIGEFLIRCHASEDVIRAMKDEAKRRPAKGEAVPGWRLKPGDVKTFVTDPETVFQRAFEIGISKEAFLRAVIIDRGRLRQLVVEATGRRGQWADATVESLLRGCIDEKQNAPALDRDRGLSEPPFPKPSSP